MRGGDIMLSTKDMVLCCHDYDLMQKLSKVLVKEHDTKYSSKSVVEYCIMNNEPIDYTCLHKEFINYYTFYALSDNRWDYTRSFLTCDLQDVIVVLYFVDCVVLCHNVKLFTCIEKDSLHLFSPVIVSWENVECLLKGE